jgi:hypothetical protein
MKQVPHLYVLSVVAITAAGCGSSDSKTPATNASNAPKTSTSAPPALLGQYQRFVSKADIERTEKKRSELGPNQEKPKPAVTLLFLEPGTLTTRDPKATFVVQQDYSATSGGKLVIRGYQHPDVGSFCGPEVPQNASYTWKKTGDKLSLRAVGDPCADRDSTLTGTWSRKR